MRITTAEGEDLLASWLQESTFVRVEMIGANVSLSFTGLLARYSNIELVFARGSDEMSISTFFGTHSLNEGPVIADVSGFWRTYRRVVQITTDGGAQLHLYQLR